MSKKNSFFNEDNQFEWFAAVGWAVFTLILMSIGGLDFWTTLIVMVVLIFITFGVFFWIIIMAGAITIGAMGLCYFILKKLFGVLSLKILMGIFGILVTLLVVGMLFVPDSKKLSKHRHSPHKTHTIARLLMQTTHHHNHHNGSPIHGTPPLGTGFNYQAKSQN